MYKPIEITVVIPVYNRKRLVIDAIESVIAQTYPHWKLIIVDDGSKDGTPERIERKYSNEERIQLVSLPKNQGVSHAMNHALKLIDTDYFIQLDSDDWFFPYTLEKMVEAIENSKENTGLYYGNVIMWVKRRGKWKVSRKIKHRSFRSKYQFLRYLTYMVHPRCYRTEAVRDVGGWDTDDPYRGRVMEDRRMVLKIMEKYPVQWVNEYLYHRRKHRSQLTHPNKKRQRNRLRKMVIEHYLKKWGNQYEPVYAMKNGWLVVKRFKRKAGGSL